MSRDNASQRVLQARATTVGNADSLANTIGMTLTDGAQCWVKDREHNYRFLKHSVLHPDGELVISPVDGHGRWVREAGLVGFAILQGGSRAGGHAAFSRYDKQHLVQFAVSPDGWVIYTGLVPRAAFAHGSADAQVGIGLLVCFATGQTEPYPGSAPNSAQALLLLSPGDRISLQTLSVSDLPAQGALHVVLL